MPAVALVLLLVLPGAARAASASADVSVLQSDSQDPVKAGGLVSYTISVTNNGPDAAANLSFDGNTPTGTTFSSIQSNFSLGQPCTKPGIAQGGSINCKLGFALASGQTWTLTLGVTVNNASPPSMLTDTATVSSGTPDPSSGNNTDDETTTVEAQTTAVALRSLSATRTGRRVVVAAGLRSFTRCRSAGGVREDG